MKLSKYLRPDLSIWQVFYNWCYRQISVDIIKSSEDLIFNPSQHTSTSCWKICISELLTIILTIYRSTYYFQLCTNAAGWMFEVGHNIVCMSYQILCIMFYSTCWQLLLFLSEGRRQLAPAPSSDLVGRHSGFKTLETVSGNMHAVKP